MNIQTKSLTQKQNTTNIFCSITIKTNAIDSFYIIKNSTSVDATFSFYFNACLKTKKI